MDWMDWIGFEGSGFSRPFGHNRNRRLLKMFHLHIVGTRGKVDRNILYCQNAVKNVRNVKHSNIIFRHGSNTRR